MYTHYQALELPATASQDDISAAYRSLARQYHPDRNSSLSAAEIFSRITQAYDILRDPLERKKYDQLLKNAQSSCLHYVEYRLRVPLRDLCRGAIAKVKVGEAEYSIDLPKGTWPGTRILCKQYRVAFIIEEIEGKVWVRKVVDLHIAFALTSQQILDGCCLNFDHLDGRYLTIDIPRNSLPGDVLKMANTGFVDQSGTLYIHLEADDPHIAQLNSAISTLSLKTPAAPTFKLPAASATQSVLPSGPWCHGITTRPIGLRSEWHYVFADRHKWTCCGSQAKEPITRPGGLTALSRDWWLLGVCVASPEDPEKPL